MIKNAFNKNKLSFILYTVILGLFTLGFIFSAFPQILDYGFGMKVATPLYLMSDLDVVIILATILCALPLFVSEHEKLTRTLKTIALSVLVAFLAKDVLINFITMLVTPDYFITEQIIMLVGEFLFLTVGILLVIGHVKDFPAMYNVIVTAISLVAFFLCFICGIISVAKSEVFLFAELYNVLFVPTSIALLYIANFFYCFDIGDAF